MKGRLSSVVGWQNPNVGMVSDFFVTYKQFEAANIFHINPNLPYFILKRYVPDVFLDVSSMKSNICITDMGWF